MHAVSITLTSPIATGIMQCLQLEGIRLRSAKGRPLIEVTPLVLNVFVALFQCYCNCMLALYVKEPHVSELRVGYVLFKYDTVKPWVKEGVEMPCSTAARLSCRVQQPTELTGEFVDEGAFEYCAVKLSSGRLKRRG